MISKSCAEKYLYALADQDETMLSRLKYPAMSGYCRDYRAGYRKSDDADLERDIELARMTLHSMSETHRRDYEILKAKYWRGLPLRRNAVNSSLRVFRRRFTSEGFEPKYTHFF